MSAPSVAAVIDALPALSDAARLEPEWLNQPRRIHMIGLGGAGMSAIATVLVAMGHKVSGSDIKGSPALSRLRALGVETHIGHSADSVGGADAVVFSSAVRPANPEMAEAERIGIPRWRRSQLLAAVIATRRSLAVVGTHGKTTTSSMLALALRSAGLDPSFLIGGDLNEVGSNAHWGAGELVVAEADESDGTFLLLEPEGAVMTGVEADHLENWGGSFAALEEGFARFARQVTGPLVVNVDDHGAAAALGSSGVDAITYGEKEDADYRLDVRSVDRRGTRLTIRRGEKFLLEATLPLPGRHFAMNATGAAALAHAYGASPEAIGSALKRFGGVERRFQFRGEGSGVEVYDDYAHLPAEVAATIEAASNLGPGRVIAIFQPHLYSRTAAFASDFADALGHADAVFVTDVFGAREEPQPGVTGRLIVDAVSASRQPAEASYVPHRGDLISSVLRAANAGDVILTMGAGDITTAAPELVIALRSREAGADV